MEDKKKARTISIQVTPETKEKAVWLVRQSCRSLSAYVRQLLAGKAVELTADTPGPGRVTVYANLAGTSEKFLFTAL